MKLQLFYLIGAGLMASPLLAGNIEVQVPNAAQGGQIRAALFQGQQAFERGDRVAGVISTPQSGNTSLVFTGIDNGTYGIALFQDLNGNERLDRNLFGRPTEPFGFSTNPRIGMRAPGFGEFAFRHDGQNQVIVIRLNGN